MRTHALLPRSLGARLVMLALLGASVVGCGHALVMQLIGRSGDACDLARPFACDADGERLLECRPQRGNDEARVPREPGVWGVRCPCIDGCTVELISEGGGFDPVESFTAIDCRCASDT